MELNSVQLVFYPTGPGSLTIAPMSLEDFSISQKVALQDRGGGVRTHSFLIGYGRIQHEPATLFGGVGAIECRRIPWVETGLQWVVTTSKENLCCIASRRSRLSCYLRQVFAGATRRSLTPFRAARENEMYLAGGSNSAGRVQPCKG